jgi:hypothetical protein
MERLTNDRLETMGPDDEVAGTGLSVAEIQGVARRQLIGSIAVAIFIAGVAGLAVMKPASTDASLATTRGFTVVQQPVLTTPAGHHIAAMKNVSEVP